MAAADIVAAIDGELPCQIDPDTICPICKVIMSSPSAVFCIAGKHAICMSCDVMMTQHAVADATQNELHAGVRLCPICRSILMPASSASIALRNTAARLLQAQQHCAALESLLRQHKLPVPAAPAIPPEQPPARYIPDGDYARLVWYRLRAAEAMERVQIFVAHVQAEANLYIDYAAALMHELPPPPLV